MESLHLHNSAGRTGAFAYTKATEVTHLQGALSVLSVPHAAGQALGGVLISCRLFEEATLKSTLQQMSSVQSQHLNNWHDHMWAEPP